MGNDHFPSPRVLHPDPDSGAILIREACGLAHERQIFTVACGPDVPPDAKIFFYRDAASGREFPAQRSRQDASLAFVQIELGAYEEYRLVFHKKTDEIDSPVRLTKPNGLQQVIISNEGWDAIVFLGEWEKRDKRPLLLPPAPVKKFRIKGGPWRGGAYFDTRKPVRFATGTLVESGPLRMVVQYHATVGEEQFYSARLVFDAGAGFIAIDEDFSCGSADQIVWDFSGDDLPEEIHLLDSTAGFSSKRLHYFFDRRLARLACWNQYSQLHDFSDGYAITFQRNDDVVGFVVLGGGNWNGNSHNFLEAWARRWLPHDPDSRRLPFELKADGAHSPERIAARPANRCQPLFTIEGWLRRGRRSFALVLASKIELRDAAWDSAPPLGHFETQPDRTRYRQQQSLLRRIHTQHGMFPLADQLAICWSWPVEKAPANVKAAAAPWDDRENRFGIPRHAMEVSKRVDDMLEFLSARIFGFWEGSGSAYTNAVVSRRLAHDLTDWEWLASRGHFTAEQSRQIRTWFIFLAHLFSSDHYYPGTASMNLRDPDLSLEPAMAGMANQNFFTDVFNMPGMAAQVFHAHPDAAIWRGRFTTMWHRQLEYHVYPKSGVWEESHTYFHHVLQTVIPTIERRRNDGLSDGFEEPAFQNLVSSLLKLLTPKDASFGGKRHVVALGDHGVDLNDLYRPLYRNLAENISGSNPALAAQLAWAYLEMGGNQPLTVKPEPAPLRNEYVQGLGYFFRSCDARGESLMVLRCGNSWAHHHNDDGSLQFFCAGRAWIVDSAFSYPQKNGVRKFRADGHSRWMPRDLYPLNHFWQFNRGWITHHTEAGPFPCAVAFTPVYMAEASGQDYVPLRHPILHWRGVVQLSSSAYLILDRSDADIPQVIRFHIPLDAPLILEDESSSNIPAESHLRIQSLSGLHPPQIPASDHPTQAADAFATREIQYALTGKPFTALVVLIENAGSPTLKIGKKDDRITLEHPEFSVALETGAPEAINLVDLKTGNRQVIPSGPDKAAN